MNAGRILKEGESVPGILGAENNSNPLMHRQSLEKTGKQKVLNVLYVD